MSSPDPPAKRAQSGSDRLVYDEAIGRKKIVIKKIEDDRSSSITFLKRKNGLMKKAAELSILCDCDIALVIFNKQGKMFKFASDGDFDGIVHRGMDSHIEAHEFKTNDELCGVNVSSSSSPAPESGIGSEAAPNLLRGSRPLPASQIGGPVGAISQLGSEPVQSLYPTMTPRSQKQFEELTKQIAAPPAAGVGKPAQRKAGFASSPLEEYVGSGQSNHGEEGGDDEEEEEEEGEEDEREPMAAKTRGRKRAGNVRHSVESEKKRRKGYESLSIQLTDGSSGPHLMPQSQQIQQQLPLGQGEGFPPDQHFLRNQQFLQSQQSEQQQQRQQTQYVHYQHPLLSQQSQPLLLSATAAGAVDREQQQQQQLHQQQQPPPTQQQQRQQQRVHKMPLASPTAAGSTPSSDSTGRTEVAADARGAFTGLLGPGGSSGMGHFGAFPSPFHPLGPYPSQTPTAGLFGALDSTAFMPSGLTGVSTPSAFGMGTPKLFSPSAYLDWPAGQPPLGPPTATDFSKPVTNAGARSRQPPPQSQTQPQSQPQPQGWPSHDPQVS